MPGYEWSYKSIKYTRIRGQSRQRFAQYAKHCSKVCRFLFKRVVLPFPLFGIAIAFCAIKPMTEFIFGSSAAMRQLQRRAEQIANSPLAVLIEGETGTGKQLLARYIHGRAG